MITFHRSVRTAFASLVVLLAACATAAPTFSTEVRHIKRKDLKHFWVMDTVSFVSDPSAAAATLEGANGFVLAEIVIDSNGRVVEHKIVQSEPSGLFTSDAERLFRLSRYVPAPDNHARVPVRVLAAITFGNSEEAQERFHRVIEEKDW